MRDHDLLPTARALGEDVDVPSVDDLVESFRHTLVTIPHPE